MINSIATVEKTLFYDRENMGAHYENSEKDQKLLMLLRH